MAVCDSLESLVDKHKEVCLKLEAFRQERTIEENRWRKVVVNEQGIEESVVDYKAWEQHDKDSFERYTTSEYYVLDLIKWLEKQIELRRCSGD